MALHLREAVSHFVDFRNALDALIGPCSLFLAVLDYLFIRLYLRQSKVYAYQVVDNPYLSNSVCPESPSLKHERPQLKSDEVHFPGRCITYNPWDSKE